MSFIIMRSTIGLSTLSYYNWTQDIIVYKQESIEESTQTSANSWEHWKSFKPINLNPFFSNLEIISPT